jgi:hypothetical protein
VANVKTFTDTNRLDLNLDKYDVYEVMPGHYDELYPNLASFLIKYYESLDDEASPAKLVNELLTNRDVVSVREEFLGLLSNELLLGKPYFEQFKDKRTALQFSNLLYRSKGTKYSIQQFFRIFYSLDVDVFYGRDYVFNVGQPTQERLEYETQGSLSGSSFRYTFPNGALEVFVNDSDEWHSMRQDVDYLQNFSEKRIEFLERDLDELGVPKDGLGYVHDTAIFEHLAETGYVGFDADSAETRVRLITDLEDYSPIGSSTVRRITNDKFYQLFALMIQTPVSVNVWREAYKTFIHPAGMYLQGRVQIVSVVHMDITASTTITQPRYSSSQTEIASVFGHKDGQFTTDMTELWEGPYGYLQRSRPNDMTRTEYPNTPSDALLIGDFDSDDSKGWGRQYYDMHRADIIESRTFDDVNINLSNTINTLDENVYLYFDSDGGGNPWLPGTIDNRPTDTIIRSIIVTETDKYILTQDGRVLFWETKLN